jgi:TPR repeat protein
MPQKVKRNQKHDFVADESSADFDTVMRMAENGSARFQLRLAEMYREGKEVPKNDAAAFRWFLDAANQDEIMAFNPVAESFFHGLGTDRNLKEAHKWAMRLAYPETTEAPTKTYMSLMLGAQILMAGIHNAPGELYDPIAAYAWVLLAVCYGQPRHTIITPFNQPLAMAEANRAAMLEQAKAKMESELTDEQRAAGQKMAADLYRPD